MRTPGRNTASVLIALSIAWAVLLANSPATAGEPVTIDGVPHIRNGSEPAEGREIKRLDELWRVGGSHDDVIFGMITQVVADAEGDIFLLDSQLCEVQVYSPDGEHRTTLFHEGDGPGEVRRPRNLCLLADGTVGVLMEFPGRLVRVDRGNVPAPTVEVFKPGSGAFIALDGCFAGGPTLLLSGNIIARAVEGVEARTNFLAIYDLDGEEQARLASYDYERNFNRFVFSERVELPSFFWANCIDGDGRVYTAPDRNRYRVEVYSPTGKLERVIERDYEHLQRSEAALRRIRDGIDAVLASAPFPHELDLERNEYDILAMQHGVRVREDGSLWVLPGRGASDQSDGIMLTFDVFDHDGQFVRQVSMQCPGDGMRDGFFFVGPDRAVVVTDHIAAMISQYADGGAAVGSDEDDASAMEVICYRIP